MTLFEKRKETLLKKLLKGIVIGGGLAYLPSLIASLYYTLYLLAVIDTLAYLTLVILYLLPHIRYELRVTAMMLVTLLLGTAVLLETGTDGAGHVWLLCAVFIAALFGQMRVIILSIVLSQASMLLYALLSVSRIIPQQSSFISIAAIAANMLLISIVVSLVTFELVKHLKKEIDAQEGVLRLLHHRIKNNLQTVESLASLDEVSSESNRRLRRRIRAVAAANELLVDDHYRPSFSLGELIRVITVPQEVRVEETVAQQITADKVAETVVGLSDLLELVKSAGPLEISIGSTINIKGSAPLPSSAELTAAAVDLLFDPGWIKSADGNPGGSIILNLG